MQTCTLGSPLPNTLCFSLLIPQLLSLLIGCLPEPEGRTLLLKIIHFSHGTWKKQAAADLEVSLPCLALTVSQVLGKPHGMIVTNSPTHLHNAALLLLIKGRLFAKNHNYYKNPQLIKVQRTSDCGIPIPQWEICSTTPAPKAQWEGQFSSWMNSLLSCS